MGRRGEEFLRVGDAVTVAVEEGGDGCGGGDVEGEIGRGVCGSELFAADALSAVEWVADREAVDRGELAGARAEGQHLEAVSDGRAEAIHEGQIEHPVERGGT